MGQRPEDLLRLDFADGFGYIVDGDKSVWAQDILHKRLVEHDDVGFVTFCGDDATTLQDALTSHKVRHVPLGEGNAIGLANVYVFDIGQFHGCRIWWGLNSVWEVVGRVCGWLSNWVRWWTKKFARLGFGPLHYRPGLKSPKQFSTCSSGLDLGIDHRCLPEASCSTAALLALMAQASRDGGRKNASQAMHWR